MALTPWMRMVPESTDSPSLVPDRYNPILAKRLEELGGVKHIFLTHRHVCEGLIVCVGLSPPA